MVEIDLVVPDESDLVVLDGDGRPYLVFAAGSHVAIRLPEGFGTQTVPGAAWLPSLDLSGWLKAQLEQTDAGLIRGIDDLVTALKAKGVLADADLPAELRDKLAARASLRTQLRSPGRT